MKKLMNVMILFIAVLCMSILPACEETTSTTITLTPNFGNATDVIGAKLTMTNNTGKKSKVYKQTAKGTATLFDKIVPGTYTLNIKHKDYFVVTLENVTVHNTATGYTVNLIRKGRAGGVVFYDKGSVSNGWRFLEAAPANTEFNAVWSASIHDIPRTKEEIGTGKQNTQLIVNDLNSKGQTGTAVQLCANININGCSDWFLPSINELSEMYQMRSLIGDFQNDYYWSSSQGNSSNALGYDFNYGHQKSYSKYSTLSVRAIRAF